MRNPFKQQPQQRTNAEIVGDHLFSFERACETAALAKFKMYRDQEAANG